MQELPIACTLTPGAMTGRVDWLRRLGAESLLSGERRDDHLALRFDVAAEDEVRRWVGAEAQCCAFLEFDLERSDDELRARIACPAGAEPVLDVLLAALTTHPADPRG